MAELSKKEYLQRYLEDKTDSAKKRKKKKPKVKANVPCLKIVDQDIDLKSLNIGNTENSEEEDETPTIAEIIDDRPVEVKLKDIYESTRWKKVESSEMCHSDSNEIYVTSSSGKKDHEYEKIKNIFNEQKQSFQRTRYDSSNSLSSHRSYKQNKRTNSSDSDISPLRKQENICKIRHDSDQDLSPLRNHKQNRRINNSDSDISPPRHKDAVMSDKQRRSRRDSDSDISPPRYQNKNKLDKQFKNRHDSDSDSLSMQLKSNSLDVKEKKRLGKNKNYDHDSSPSYSKTSCRDENKKLNKTLSGLKAGLQNSETLKQEVKELRKKEKMQISMLDEGLSGRNADTIIRDKRTGLKRDLEQEQHVKDKEDRKAKEHQQKYLEWGKGIEQSQSKKEKFEDDLYEMSKPLARYCDDEDLDQKLKSVIHDDDPMLEYIKKKRKKDAPSKPVYTGPPAPPNRFGIMPGYRWDGVDRSNGFERRYFEKLNSSKASQEEAYLWSVQNM